MNDYHVRAEERDNSLAQGCSQAARNLRMELCEWIQSEIKETLYRAEILEVTAEGVVKSNLQHSISRMREIDRQELNDARNSLDTKISEIRDGAFDDPLDARRYLDEGILRLESLVRELLAVRRLIDSFWRG